MIVGGILDLISGITRIVGERVGERRREWARFAVEAPAAAALLLERSAGELEGSVQAMRPKRQRRWVARRRLAKARALRDLAIDIRDHAKGRECRGDPTRRPV